MIAHVDCPCGGAYESRATPVAFAVDGRTVSLPEVTYGQCPRCGSRVYPAGALRLVEAAYKGWPSSAS